jgi:hypothetical protein
MYIRHHQKTKFFHANFGLNMAKTGVVPYLPVSVNYTLVGLKTPAEL